MTIGTPSLNSVSAGPGGIFEDLDHHRGRVAVQIFSVIGQSYRLARLDNLERRRKRHVTESLMVAIGFAIGGDVDDLRPRPSMVETAHQPIRQTMSAPEKIFERHGMGNWAIIEENRKLSP
jgi:hypothetical protein